MLAEFVKSIAAMAKAETKFESFTTDAGETYLRLPDGTIEQIDRQPKPRRFHTADLSSFATAIHDEGGNPVVLVNPRGAVCYFDPQFREDSITLNVSWSAAYIALIELTGWLPQKRVVELLRDGLADSCDPALLPIMRKLDWTRKSDGSRSIEHGRESLGRSVEQSVQSRAGELGERYEFEVPLFGNDDFAAWSPAIACSVDTDPTNERIRFTPIGDDLQHAIDGGTRFLRDEIAARIEGEAIVLIADERDV